MKLKNIVCGGVGLTVFALWCLLTLATNAQPAAVAPSPKGSPTFEVTAYELEGNTLLKRSEIQTVVAPFTGHAVNYDLVRQALLALQGYYRSRGFVTVGLGLPPQRLTNGIVRVQVTEGRLADINILGNGHYSSNNIRRALPSLSTNVVLNTHWFQPELDRANLNPDRQIYPVIGPGPDPGTSVLTLKIKDRLPLHGYVELDNRATPGTPALRLDTALQYNNLWQRDHQLGFQYSFSPQELKDNDGYPRHLLYDQPRVASYSAFYRIPLGFASQAREDYEKAPVNFGYDTVTHAFRAPALTGGPELIVYASRSASEIPASLGPLTSITNTVLLDTSSQTANRTLSWNENIGTRLSWPLPEFKGVRSTLSLGGDFKTYQADNLSTNLFYYDTYTTDPVTLVRSLNSSQVIPFASNSSNYLAYASLSWSWAGSRPDGRGFTAFNLGQNLYFDALSSGSDRVRQVAGSSKAGGNFTTLAAGVVREQRLVGDWALSLRVNGQWASAPLISNEQFGVGGTAGVRGYEEGEEYGDSGWRLLVEPRAPNWRIGRLPTISDFIPVNLRLSAFVDYGERYLDDPSASRKGVERMLGAGGAALVNAGEYLEARLTLAWALLDTPGTAVGTARAYFSLRAQF